MNDVALRGFSASSLFLFSFFLYYAHWNSSEELLTGQAGNRPTDRPTNSPPRQVMEVRRHKVKTSVIIIIKYNINFVENYYSASRNRRLIKKKKKKRCKITVEAIFFFFLFYTKSFKRNISPDFLLGRHSECRDLNETNRIVAFIFGQFLRLSFFKKFFASRTV